MKQSGSVPDQRIYHRRFNSVLADLIFDTHKQLNVLKFCEIFHIVKKIKANLKFEIPTTTRKSKQVARGLSLKFLKNEVLMFT